MIFRNKDIKIAVIGLGYVGLPLAIELAKKFKVYGYDINKERVKDLKLNIDNTLEVDSSTLKKTKVNFSFNEKILNKANTFIVTVPTGINRKNLPDLRLLKQSTYTISKYLKSKSLIIYESTVYPGCIEEECVPVLEKFSKLKFNQDFFCGYSPERINPGDKEHTISKIKKVTSGSTPEIAELVDKLYKEIITAGTHKASSIKVAEAAKVIENTQRDLNIALMNELSILFSKLNIDTNEVLDAAKSKWNFLPFAPGLVGGHCIGIDPYYLTYKAKNIGYHPKVILAGRKINDEMGNYAASQMINKMKKIKIKIKNSKILIMGMTFKENCSDIRNSGVSSVIDKLKKYALDIS